jgi:maltooligosyltrehalose trehalohydrolase
MTKRVDNRTIGVNYTEHGTATIKVWAPLAKHCAIQINDTLTIDLCSETLGYWILETDQLKPGDQYRILLEDKRYPDPASLYQPGGVEGPSAVINLHDFKWSDDSWVNPGLENYIFYELHTGTFSPKETFEGIIKKLDHLVDLGITAIELMPVAQFPGERNWGYDGVFPFAVQNTYGGPAGLQKLVDACHQQGLAVVLDVVYNHLGPEGNYLPAFGPYFTEKHKTPWGSAINFDDAWCDGVRDFYIQNALMWFRDFHIDALRLDAVHAIKDLSPKHILQEIKEQVNELAKVTGKTYHLIVECDLNDPKFINAIPGGYGMNAQWTDEFHHALRVTAGEPRNGYYADFNGIADLAKSYRDAYVYDGQYSEERHKLFGVKTNNPGRQFVVFSQNHDQIGNRMLGERTSSLVSFDMQKLMALAVMVSPYLPLLFMGEEWSATTPFQYFVSHSGKELIAAVQKGRKEEFKAFHRENDTPDPQSPATFQNSKLDWETLNLEMLAFYRSLIALRKQEPALKNLNRANVKVSADQETNVLRLERWCDGQEICCFMNFSSSPQEITVPGNWQKLFETTVNSLYGTTLKPESAIIYTLYHV